MNMHFVSMEARNAEAKRLKADNPRVRLRKSSSRGIVLSPDYVIGYEGPRHRGLGGSTEPTYFGVVYNLEVIR